MPLRQSLPSESGRNERPGPLLCRESEQGTSTSEPAGAGLFPANGTASGPEQTRYRIASVGQDCQLLLWDFVVEEESYLDALDTAESR